MTKLEEIVAFKKRELQELKREQPVGRLERALKDRLPVRSFRKAIHQEGQLSLIAEFKRSSPTAGPIRPQADPVEMAVGYARAGAQALSVLTDAQFFSGSLTDLISTREKVAVPVLRKDFLLEEYQVVESAAAGADAILLISAILEKTVLKRLLGLVHDVELDALLEIHTERELETALEVGADLIGINNRDLNNFTVDLKTTQRLIPLIPKDKTVVSESGIRSRADVEFLQGHGAHAILVGEELMACSDPSRKIKELMNW